ncbi:MAG: amidase [Candidatus Kariarchaeaceae archaeon]
MGYYMSAIKKYNPEINAIISLNPNALAEARKLDELTLKNEILGPLHGLPVVIKDSIETKDMYTTAGSKQLEEYLPDEDSIAVARIKTAGGIILGKSNTPEMTIDIQTFNPLFGTTNNPWNPKKTAGGSSGGSTAAVATGMVPLALGSDLAGSLRIPASFCGVTSLRPTEGRLPIQGHIPPLPGNPVSSSEITMGPIAKRTFGVELLMQALCGQSSNYEYPPTPYSPKSTPDRSEVTIALTTDFPSFPTDQKIIDHMVNLSEKLNSDGIPTTIDSVSLPLKQMNEAHTIFYQQLSESKNLENLFKPTIDDKSPRTSQLLAALKIRDEARKIVHSFLDKYTVWILPVTSTLPFDHNPNHEKIIINDNLVSYWKATISYSVPFSLIGNPILTLPTGLIDGLPIGVQIIGKRWGDEELVAVGRLLEEIFEEADPENFPSIEM